MPSNHYCDLGMRFLFLRALRAFVVKSTAGSRIISAFQLFSFQLSVFSFSLSPPAHPHTHTLSFPVPNASAHTLFPCPHSLNSLNSFNSLITPLPSFSFRVFRVFRGLNLNLSTFQPFNLSTLQPFTLLSPHYPI